MPRSKPPTPAHHRAATTARAVPANPLRADLGAAAVRTVASRSPLTGLTVPAPAGAAPVAVVRRLDGGRLTAPDIVDAVGWVAGQHLAVTDRGHGRVRITATLREGTAIGTHRTHTDSQRRIVLATGVRKLLGLGTDSSVIAHVCDDGSVEVASTALIAAAFAALDRPLVASVDTIGQRTAATA